MICLLVMTDGRADQLAGTMAAYRAMVSGPVTTTVIHDDAANATYHRWLRGAFPGCQIIGGPGRLGFAGAMRNAWSHLARRVEEPFVFHLEDDFAVTRKTDLRDLAGLLLTQPHLAQVSLRRQPWGGEPDPGGFIAAHPDWYADRVSEDGSWRWVETARGWTCNPNLHRRELTVTGPAWPDGPQSEGRYGFELADSGLPWGVPAESVRFGIWGDRGTSEGWVRHTGHQRNGWGY